MLAYRAHCCSGSLTSAILGGLTGPAYDLIASAEPIGGSLGAGTSGTVDGYAANLAGQGDNLVPNVVPEPGTLALLAAGALVLLAYGIKLYG